ncbi:MAG: Mur ligase family protein, partial [Lysobacterales bacterium]
MNAALRKIGKHGTDGEMRVTGAGASLEIYGELVLALQRHAGHEVAYSRVETSATVNRVFIEYEDHATTLYAADVALDILNAIHATPDSLAPDAISSLREQLDEYVSFAMARRPDPNTRLLREAARRQDIPVIGMDLPWDVPTWPGAANRTGVVQYGWGINQRHCRGSLPLGSLTSRQIKACTERASLVTKLRDAGLPVAGQDLEFTNRNQVRRAQRSAARIGYPVMVRPKVVALPRYGFLDGGAFGPLDNDRQVELAVGYLREMAKADIWVEAFVPGAHYRCLVLGSEVVSVLRMAPPAVIGDGVRTVAELAQASGNSVEDAEGRRAWQRLTAGDGALLCRLQLRGMNLSSVPAPGEEILLRDRGTCYNGGAATEVLEEVPVQFSDLALQAASVPGLQEMAGVDLVIADLQGPAAMPNCAVTGVDPIPDLVAHSKAIEANAHRIPAKYFSMVLPRGGSFRIPSVSITGTNGKTTTSRMVAGILKESGLKVGLSCSDGSYLDDDILVQEDEAGVRGANEVLCNAATEAAVLETARGNMANTGIAFE